MSASVYVLAALCAAALVVWRVRPSRTVRTDLRSAIEQQRVAPLSDATRAPIPVVARALALDAVEVPPAPVPDRVIAPWRRARVRGHHEVRLMIRPLGLELVDVIRTHDPLFRPTRVIGGRTAMVGRRHGRDVHIEIEESRSAVRIGGAFGAFEIGFDRAGTGWGGTLEAPVSVVAALDGIAPHPRWHGAQVVGGPAGVILRREAEPTRSWMHDLWLAERLADVAGCPSPVEVAPRTACDVAAA